MFLPRTLIDWSRLPWAQNCEEHRDFMERFTTLLERGVKFFNDFHAHFITSMKFSFLLGFISLDYVQTVNRLLFQSIPS